MTCTTHLLVVISTTGQDHANAGAICYDTPSWGGQWVGHIFLGRGREWGTIVSHVMRNVNMHKGKMVMVGLVKITFLIVIPNDVK